MAETDKRATTTTTTTQTVRTETASPATEAKVSTPQTEPVAAASKDMLANASREAKILYLKEKNKMGGLTFDEQGELQKFKDQPADLSDAEGIAGEQHDTGLGKKKPEDPKDFKEQDIIQYMYEKWLIAGTQWVTNEAERGVQNIGGRWYRQLENKVHNARQKQEAIEKSSGNEVLKQLDKTVSDKIKGNKDKSVAEIKKIEEISKLIVSGKLFDPENAERLNEFKGYLGKLEGIEGVEPKQLPADIEVVSKAHKLASANLKSAQDKQDKEPNDENQKSLKEAEEANSKITKFLGKRAAIFSAGANAAVLYENKQENSALYGAASDIKNEIVKNNKQELVDKKGSIGKDFDARFNKFLDDAKKRTDNERKSYVEQHIESARAQTDYDGFNGTFIPLKVETARVDGLEKGSKQAGKRLSQSIKSGNTKEFGNTPEENNHVNNVWDNDTGQENKTDTTTTKSEEKQVGLDSDAAERAETDIVHQELLKKFEQRIQEKQDELDAPEREEERNRIDRLKNKIKEGKGTKNSEEHEKNSEDKEHNSTNRFNRNRGRE